VDGVGAHARGQVDLDRFGIAREGPLVAGRVGGIQRHLAADQVRRPLRLAPAFDERRGHAEDAAQREQAPRDQRIVLGREDLEGHVEAFFDRVDDAVVDDDVQLDIRILLAEAGQDVGEVPDGKPGQHLDAQAPGRGGAQVAHLVGQVGQVGDHVGALTIVGLAHFRQAHVPRAAMEQRRVDVLLELLHAVNWSRRAGARPRQS
jgi:hypothetical protein